MAHSVNSDPYPNGRYRRHSGHCSALAGDGSVANDPKRTSAARFCCDAAHGARSGIVLDFYKDGSQPGRKSHDAAGEFICLFGITVVE
jgi:hypothetical protein